MNTRAGECLFPERDILPGVLIARWRSSDPPWVCWRVLRSLQLSQRGSMARQLSAGSGTSIVTRDPTSPCVV